MSKRFVSLSENLLFFSAAFFCLMCSAIFSAPKENSAVVPIEVTSHKINNISDVNFKKSDCLSVYYDDPRYSISISFTKEEFNHVKDLLQEDEIVIQELPDRFTMYKWIKFTFRSTQENSSGRWLIHEWVGYARVDSLSLELKNLISEEMQKSTQEVIMKLSE